MSRGQFTGDVLHSGIGGGRNSSRVLAPPGGGCSDIFGTGASYAPNETAVMAQSKRNESNVFRSPAKSDVVCEKAAAAARRGQSSVFAADSPMKNCASYDSGISQVFAADAAVAAPRSPSRRAAPDAPVAEVVAQEDFQQNRGHGHGGNKGQFTGDSLMAGYSSSRPSIRMAAPPGGHCSNIFG